MKQTVEKYEASLLSLKIKNKLAEGWLVHTIATYTDVDGAPLAVVVFYKE